MPKIGDTVLSSSSELVLFVRDNWTNFDEKPGSDHIASRSSQLNLVERLVKSRPKSILDWGSGIGTLIPLYLEMTTAQIVAFERNSWCHSQFEKNVDSTDKRILVVSSFPEEKSFDFIVIDDEVKFCEISKLMASADFPLEVFIEGWRNSTVAKISVALLMHGYPGTFKRCRSRLGEFQENNCLEKAGSFFQVHHRSLIGSFRSWIVRKNETHELVEIRDLVFRKLGIFRFLAKITLGRKLRRLLFIKPPDNRKRWKRTQEFEEKGFS